MSISLSPRLKACSRFVAKGDRVADIGCDHGYLGIYLLTEGIASSVIAADINEGPLQSARNNAKKYEVNDQITFYLSDGAQSIPREFDVMICAGMGADTIISILDASPWLKNGAYRLVLQCQSKTPMLRQYLSDQGWLITDEDVLRDGRFLYTVMHIVFCPEAPRLRNDQYYFPPIILKNPNPIAGEYYQQVVNRLQRSVDGQGENANNNILQALATLRLLPTFPETQWLKEEHK